MAEVGLVHFAHVARAVAETVLPRYRSKYSKHLQVLLLGLAYDIYRVRRALLLSLG